MDPKPESKKEVKIYTVDQQQILIDINKNMVNFYATFRLELKNGQPIDFLVCDQNELDVNPNLSFRTLNPKDPVNPSSEISGEDHSNVNVFQNHFIILKLNSNASEPSEVEVELNVQELPPVNPPSEEKKKELTGETEGSGKYLKIGLVIVILLIGGYFAYQYFYPTSVKGSIEKKKSPPKVETRVETPKVDVKSEVPKVEAPPLKTETIISRMKKFNIKSPS